MSWQLLGKALLAAALGGAIPAVADALTSGKSLSETKTIAIAGALTGISLYLKTPHKEEGKQETQETQERKS